MPSATPIAPHIDLGLGGSSAAEEAARRAEWATRRREVDAVSFPQSAYVALGLWIQKSVQNGCIHDPDAFTTSANPDAAPKVCCTTLPRFPTLSELRASLLTHLPSKDGFNAACESYLVEGLQRLTTLDQLQELISGLSGLLVNYSHKIEIHPAPLPSCVSSAGGFIEPLKALDENTDLGCFLREVRLAFDTPARQFETLSGVFEAVRRYKLQGGLAVMHDEAGEELFPEDVIPAAADDADGDAEVQAAAAQDMDLGDDDAGDRTLQLASGSPAINLSQQQQQQLHPNISVRPDRTPAVVGGKTAARARRSLDPLLAQVDESMVALPDDDAAWLSRPAATAQQRTQQQTQGWKDPWLLVGFDGEEEAAEVAAVVPQKQQQLQSSEGSDEPQQSEYVSASVLVPYLQSQTSLLPLFSGQLLPGSLPRFVRSVRASYGLDESGADYIPFVHFLAVQAHAVEREFLEAQEESYRYFDYFSGQAAETAATQARLQAAAAQEDGSPPLAVAAPARRALTQQYASYYLAQLHERFGHYSAAIVSLRETVRLAQMHKDSTCLRFALTLLRTIIERKGGGSGGGRDGNAATASLLHRCLVTQANAAARAHRSINAAAAAASPPASGSTVPIPLPSLDATTALTMAKFESTRIDARAGGAVRPELVWKEIERAGALASVHGLREMHSTAHVIRSGVWALYGMNFLSHLSASLLLPPISDPDAKQKHLTAADQMHALVGLLSSPGSCGSLAERHRLLRFIQARYPYPSSGGDGGDPASHFLVLHAAFELHLSCGDLASATRDAQSLANLAVSPLVEYRPFLLTSLAQIRLAARVCSSSLVSLVSQTIDLARECSERFERQLALKCMTVLVDELLSRAPCDLASPQSSLLLRIGLSPLLSAHSLARSLRAVHVELCLLLVVAESLWSLGDVGSAERVAREALAALLARGMPPPRAHSAKRPQSASLPLGSLSGPYVCADPVLSGHLLRAKLLLAHCEMSRIAACVAECESESRVSSSWRVVVRLLREALACQHTAQQQQQQRRSQHASPCRLSFVAHSVCAVRVQMPPPLPTCATCTTCLRALTRSCTCATNGISARSNSASMLSPRSHCPAHIEDTNVGCWFKR